MQRWLITWHWYLQYLWITYHKRFGLNIIGNACRILQITFWYRQYQIAYQGRRGGGKVFALALAGSGVSSPNTMSPHALSKPLSQSQLNHIGMRGASSMTMRDLSWKVLYRQSSREHILLQNAHLSKRNLSAILSPTLKPQGLHRHVVIARPSHWARFPLPL